MTMAYHLLATVLVLLVTSVVGQVNLSTQDQDINGTQSNSENATGIGVLEATLLKSNAYPMLFRGSGNSTRSSSSSSWCRQKNKCIKQGGICQAKGTCPGRSAQDCNQGCDCCLPDEGWCHHIDLRKCNGELEKLCSIMCGSVNSFTTEASTNTEKPSDCPAYFEAIGQNCYYFSVDYEKNLSWDAARRHCKGLGDLQGVTADLVVFDRPGSTAAEEEELMKTIARKHNIGQNPWIGAEDRETEGQFKWVQTAIEFTYSHSRWHPDKPNTFADRGHRADCIVMWMNKNSITPTYKRGLFADHYCTSSGTFVCQVFG